MSVSHSTFVLGPLSVDDEAVMYLDGSERPEDVAYVVLGQVLAGLSGGYQVPGVSVHTGESLLFETLMDSLQVLVGGGCLP